MRRSSSCRILTAAARPAAVGPAARSGWSARGMEESPRKLEDPEGFGRLSAPYPREHLPVGVISRPRRRLRANPIALTLPQEIVYPPGREVKRTAFTSIETAP